MAKSKDAALEKLEAMIEAQKMKFRAAVRAEIEGYLVKHGLTLEDLVDVKPEGKRIPANGKATRKAPFKGKQPAKYRDPKTGATWSGMGRAPGWIANARSRDKFLIQPQ